MALGDRLTGDVLSDVRSAMVRQIERQSGYLDARRAIDLPHAWNALTNPLGASVEAGAEVAFATGYNSGAGTTTTPFVWGISVWNGGDIWTG